jgi:hypothetical protein
VNGRREGHDLLRTNLAATDPAGLSTYSIQLAEVEQAFKELKGDLSISPISHQQDVRIEAHIFVAFLAYFLRLTGFSGRRSLFGYLTGFHSFQFVAAASNSSRSIF